MSLPTSIRQLEAEKSSTKEKGRGGSPVETSVFYDDREDSTGGRHMEEGRGRKGQHYDQDDEDLQMRIDFRRPRDSLLNVIAEFYSTCQARLRELRKILADPSFRPPELLDHKSHNRLAEIAHTLLKLAPYDPETMGCAGIQRYMTEILPITDWSQEAVRPALNLILRRLDRLFTKLSKKNNLKRKCDWDAAANLLKGVFLTLKKFPYIAHLPHLKTLINVLITIVLSSGSQTVMESLPGMGVFRGEHGGSIIPPIFCSEVVKLVAMQMQALGYTGHYGWIQAELMQQTSNEQFSLEQICGGMAVFPTSERCINMLVNFILPLCVRVGCGRRDTPKLRQLDINFALQVILNILNPPTKASGGSQNSTKSVMHHLSITEHGRCGSVGRNSHKNYIKYQGNELVVHTAYLGLEILMACFDKTLSPEWHRVAKCIIQNSQLRVCLPLWRFLDFVVTHRPSIFLMLQPFIEFKMMRVNCDTAQEYYVQQTIKDKLLGYSFTHPKCTGSVLVELALELKNIKEEFVATGGEYRSRSATMVTDRSDFSQTQTTQRRVEMAEITTEIIGPPKPTLATIGKRASKATILSQGSSNTSVPFKATAVTSSFDSGSPSGRRMSSGQRISAKDGTRILEKFKKPTQDDLSPTDQIVPESPDKLGRQPTVIFRPPLSEQNSIEEHQHAELQYENEVGPEVCNGQDLNPREHRLQRQDAKSRKTFKMKRTKTKTTSVRRFMSRQGPNDTSDTESNSTDGSPTRSATLRAKGVKEKENLRLHRTGTGTQTPRSGSPAFMAKSSEALHEHKDNVKKSSSRPRYIQRSKSHDDPHADGIAPSGTAKGRIARQGARMVRDRSPSSSPVRTSKSPITDPMSPPPRGRSFDSPMEDPVNMAFGSVLGAYSPPASAQSVNEGQYHFRFSLRKRNPVSTEPQSSDQTSLKSIGSPINPSVSSPLSFTSLTNPFSPPAYDKPKPLVTSPDKKFNSLVKSRIQMFTMSEDTNKPILQKPGISETVTPLAPPPIPPRQQRFVKSYTIDTDTLSPTSPTSPIYSKPFTFRDRQQPFSPTEKQKAVSNLLYDLPVSEQSAFHTPASKYSPTKNTNPFMISPDTPPVESTTSKTTNGNSDTSTQAYMTSRCSSDESLTEFTSLLKDDEKSDSRSSVCIYFDGKDIPDTLV